MTFWNKEGEKYTRQAIYCMNIFISGATNSNIPDHHCIPVHHYKLEYFQFTFHPQRLHFASKTVDPFEQSNIR